VSRDIAIALRAPWRVLARRAKGRTRGRRRSAAEARQRRKRIAIALAAVATLGGGWMWLRDAPLVAANDLTITGATGADAPAIRNALTDAAGDMTTLHVRLDALRTAVAPYPIVKDIRVETHFPHEMRITVVEREPVAAVAIDGARVGVASDGTLLRGRAAAENLVTLAIPSANGGGRLTSHRGRAAVAVMGAAPRAFRPYIQGIDFGPDGLRVALKTGPLLQFGDAVRARAKWIAVARVLGDPRGAGASYLDVRVPERPVAGRFDDPGQPAPVDGGVPDQAGAADGTTGDGTAGDGTTTQAATAAPPSGVDQAGQDAQSTDSTTTSQDTQSGVEGQ
jgi:cell division protein FtsQ